MKKKENTDHSTSLFPILLMASNKDDEKGSVKVARQQYVQTLTFTFFKKYKKNNWKVLLKISENWKMEEKARSLMQFWENWFFFVKLKKSKLPPLPSLKPF